MSIDLAKRVETAGISLAKKNLKTIPVVRVGFAIDVSGSMRGMFRSGVVQETFERLFALTQKFDDNGEMDMWAYDHRSTTLEVATESNYKTYIEDVIVASDINKWGMTSFADTFQSILDRYFIGTSVKGGFFSKSKTVLPEDAHLPALALFVTDGDNGDKTEAENVLREAAKHNMYWVLVGAGTGSNFKWLKKMADDLPNVGFVSLADLNISDEALYDELISDELVGWLKSLSNSAAA